MQAFQAESQMFVDVLGEPAATATGACEVAAASMVDERGDGEGAGSTEQRGRGTETIYGGGSL